MFCIVVSHIFAKVGYHMYYAKIKALFVFYM